MLLIYCLLFYSFSCRSRCRYLFCPIRRHETIRSGSGDVGLLLEIHPEAIRWIHNLFILFFFAFSTFVSIMWAGIDFEDNPVINLFGSNSICVMMDDPPFSLFGSTLWWPAVILCLAFEILDYIRIHDHYHDKDAEYPLSRGFVMYYRISTAWECLTCIVFAQIFATSPTEYIYMHVWPYFAFLTSWVCIMLKRYLYLRHVRQIPSYWGILVFICCILTFIYLLIHVPNLHGARLWESYPWTTTVVSINKPLMGLTELVIPILLYGYICPNGESVVVTFNRRVCETGPPNTQNSRGLLRYLFQPITGWKRDLDQDGKSIKTIFETHPDSFRMCFYVYITFFLAVASFLTLMWGTIDLDDNIIVRRFGYSAFSIMFSDPPFACFASTLWFPATILLLSFEITDYLRVYFHYLEDDAKNSISKPFMVYYTVSTLIEMFSVVCEAQVFATSPSESIYMHSLPYVLFTFTFCMMIVKRYLYHRKIGVAPRYGKPHVMLCLFSTLFGMALHLPNLFGAKLWESHPWTMTLQKINDAVYSLLMVLGPMIVYSLIGKKFDTITVTVKRSADTSKKNDEKSTSV